MSEKKWIVVLGVVSLLLVTSPIFFDVYRSAAFDTVPRDDYAPYLLALTGNGGEIPGAPFAFRVFSVAVAIPFYYLLPTYTFTNLADVDTDYLRATQALSFASYLSLVLTAGLIYAIARRRFLATRVSSLIVGLSTFLLSNLVAKTGIDPFAIFLFSLALFYLHKPAVFAPLVLLAVGVNEKVPFLFAIVLTFRAVGAIARRRRFASYVQLCASWVAVAAYFVVTALAGVRGNEQQTDPTRFLSSLSSSLAYTLSPKGIVLNVIPVIAVALVALFAAKSKKKLFDVWDISGLAAVVMLSMFADVVYNIGRVAMYAYPLYLPAAACFLDDAFGLKNPDEGLGEARSEA